MGNKFSALPNLMKADDVAALFPASVTELTARVEQVIAETQHGIDVIVAYAPDERTFENTVEAADRVAARLYIMLKVAWTLQNVTPDSALRVAAQEAMVTLKNRSVDLIENNVALYRAIKEYAQGAAKTATLNTEEKYFLKHTLEQFEKNGLSFPEVQQEQIKKLKKEIAQLRLAFDTNIASVNDCVTLQHADLAGCPDDFIETLKKDDQGNYSVGVDYPTYFMVMDHCAVATTREKLWKAFSNRAYPANEQVLIKMIAARDAWAKALGFASYAHLELSDEMAKSPERVHAFLDELAEKSSAKVADEMALLKQDLPTDVVLTDKGQFRPCDLRYVLTQYKKKHAALDEEKIKEYFPMQKTVDEMFDIYEQFLGVKFRQEKLPGLWHEDAQYIGVYTREGALLGHILLDMYPRPQKYSHACMEAIVPAVRAKNGVYCPPVIIIISNFNKPTADRPALFSQNDVFTLFHELGHALHGLFGATQMAGFSGTNVKLDFVEMPSQILEEWLFDAAIMKKVSGHYITGEPLPDELIEKIIAAKRCDAGLMVRRQVMQGKLSLMLFEAGEQKNPSALHKKLVEQLLSDIVVFDSANNFPASFGHLGEYGSRYYCYMWSKVYALDMFEHIKKFGLLNYEIGKHYIEKVIGKGGSVDPEILIADFLGRQPTTDAFLKDLGL